VIAIIGREQEPGSALAPLSKEAIQTRDGVRRKERAASRGSLRSFAAKETLAPG
jgi:hypothetical protein